MRYETTIIESGGTELRVEVYIAPERPDNGKQTLYCAPVDEERNIYIFELEEERESCGTV